MKEMVGAIQGAMGRIITELRLIRQALERMSPPPPSKR